MIAQGRVRIAADNPRRVIVDDAGQPTDKGEDGQH